MLLAFDNLMDQQLEVLRRKEELNSMVNEDDRSRLVAALENTSAALEQSIAARKKLEEKYSAIKSNVKRMAKQYEVLHSKVELTQKQKQDISSSFEMAPNKACIVLQGESRGSTSA